MTGIFITGTDTDCGKTYVCCQLLDYLHQSGKRALALKPVASGAVERQGQWINDDIERLRKHNPQSSPAINAWLYADPISPHLAAQRRGERLSASEVAEFCNDEHFSGYDCVLIEGAGGLMVPLNESETWLDLLAMTAMPVILVVGIRLGCINHALLTDAVLRMQNIPCLGWIANCLDPDMQALDENIQSLSDRLSMPLLGRVARAGYFKPDMALTCWLE
ncbi:dethiobiotin synthase [Legionella sp. CNM-4043-24]|uniref:dethiobiotin synthase n=1 Tax=Legionella sp. CNM-4043-24 TaxID=3421646 RepID=UPI00403B1E7C